MFNGEDSVENEGVEVVSYLSDYGVVAIGEDMIRSALWSLFYGDIIT